MLGHCDSEHNHDFVAEIVIVATATNVGDAKKFGGFPNGVYCLVDIAKELKWQIKAFDVTVSSPFPMMWVELKDECAVRL